MSMKLSLTWVKVLIWVNILFKLSKWNFFKSMITSSSWKKKNIMIHLSQAMELKRFSSPLKWMAISSLIITGIFLLKQFLNSISNVLKEMFKLQRLQLITPFRHHCPFTVLAVIKIKRANWKLPISNKFWKSKVRMLTLSREFQFKTFKLILMINHRMRVLLIRVYNRRIFSLRI